VRSDQATGGELLENVNVVALLPRTPAWRAWVDRNLDEATQLLASAYGRRDHGSTTHALRILETEPVIVVATDVERLVGLFYVHRSGKHAALAVDSAYRRLGIAMTMMTVSLEALPDQWAELHTDDLVQRHRVGQLGFRPLHDADEARTLLGPLLSPLVESWSWDENNELTYQRRSFTNPGGSTSYLIRIAGRPRPRIDNDGTYYRIPFEPSR
jgi:GNAT superfamily N-acetyltransferase